MEENSEDTKSFTDPLAFGVWSESEALLDV